MGLQLQIQLTLRILFNYLNEYLHDVQKDNFELGKGKINLLAINMPSGEPWIEPVQH